MLKDATPQVLESAVEASVKLLDSLRAPLAEKMAGSPDAQHWMQAIDNLKKQAAKTKTVIGVVGNTGAGKSSVINAICKPIPAHPRPKNSLFCQVVTQH